MTDRDHFPPLILLLVCMIMLTACSGRTEPRLQPSGHAVTPLNRDQAFSAYVEETRRRIRQALQEGPFASENPPFDSHYSLEQVVDMRAPWQLGPASDCDPPGTTAEAFLFIHGLSDSPYTVRAIAESMARIRPCAVFRSVLLPGHGTSPGDLLTVHRDDWRVTVTNAVDQLLEQTDSVHLVGYSTGAALALEQADARRHDPGLSSLILLSPALDLGNPLGWATPLLRYVQPWLSVAPDRDAVKYESFAMNAAAEAHLLLRELTPMEMETLDRPVFIVTTADDTTVDPRVTRSFFCDRVAAQNRHMLWYRSTEEPDDTARLCEGLMLLDAAAPELQVVTLSHVGTSLPPADPHYGLLGRYRHCLGYAEGTDDQLRCQSDDEAVVYGEPGVLANETGLYRGHPVRRTTFNPHYAAMVRSLACFLREDCTP